MPDTNPTTPVRETDFIGREDTLARIDQAINEWGSRKVICIDGDGGIGKTRLLSEVYKRYASLAPEKLALTEIIDFDETSYHIPGNVENRIAQMIGQEQFEEYWQKLRDLRLIEQAGVSLKEIASQQEEARRTFVKKFNAISESKRIVLFLDTAEKQKTWDVWEQFLNILKDISNVILLVAGRHANDVWKAFGDIIGEDVEKIILPPLGHADSKCYLEEKEKKLHIHLAPDLRDGLLILAQGHPILLDLAVEWIAREIPADWISDIKLKPLKTGDLTLRQREFEELLVSKVTQIRTPIDRLCLLLSRVYPLDVEGISELLRMPAAEAGQLYAEALSYVFVKLLPNGSISLHDEMRRMIHEYVWPKVDPNGERRRHDSRLATHYLEKKITLLEKKLEKTEKTGNNAMSSSRSQQSFGSMMETGAIERDLWVLRGQFLEHLFFIDVNTGITKFNQLFDEAGRNNPRDVLVNSVIPFLDRIPDNRKYEIISRRIKLFNDKGNFEQSLSFAKLPTVNADQKLDILTKIATAKMRMGKVTDAVSDLNEALEVARTAPESDQWRTAILNILGQAHRTMGRLADASRYYDQALQIAKSSRVISKTQTAAILNNQAYVLSLEGRYRSAFTYCQEALSIRENLGTRLEIGMSYQTMGEVHRNWGKYTEALEYYNQALQIFEPENAPLWLARVYSQRGAVYRLLEEYNLAEKDLLRNIELNIPIEKPWAYHVLGLVYWNRGKHYDKALEYFEISDKLARETNDAITHINNLVAFAEVYYKVWLEKDKLDNPSITKIKTFASQMENLQKEGYDFPSHQGRLQRVLGDIAFDQERFPDAMEIYAMAYAALGKRAGGFGRRTFLDEIEGLAGKIKSLAKVNAAEAIRWCDYFSGYWSDESLPLLRRDELLSLCDVSRIEIEIQHRR